MTNNNLPFTTESQRRNIELAKQDIRSQAQAILNRPNALTPLGGINPKVISREESRIISQSGLLDKQASRISKSISINPLQAFGNIMDAWTEEAIKPITGAGASLFSPSVRSEVSKARAEGKDIFSAYREGWDKG